MCFVADFQVRLNGSSLSSAGTINVLYYGIWGGIRGYNVDIRVGHVVCRQLGYSRAERIFSFASFGGVIGPLWIWRIHSVMATKQKYLSAKWKLGTKSGIPHLITGIIIIVILTTHDMQLVCCVVKEIRAFQKVSAVINI